ncbi:PTS sugar transporter subunit IIB [Enterococcus hulanensis]|uniref:PTS sugar transporter subunit IIB n=1 Tax=Enterococcus hulanensis TaxID=2559929 RepID=UPI001A8F852D|nr:PTS sugar transporter subunit IIB [Enterococcus hulanensis]MBO0458560.1 PTS sugar transporter subunit IIB [Enterococcus hulanensis]
MKTIMLACAAGMSTSLLVTKMEKAAKEKNLEVEIFANPVSEIDQILKEKNIDCLLLGPQVSFMKNDLIKKMEKYNIPVETIDMATYGMMDGEKVLNQTLIN